MLFIWLIGKRLCVCQVSAEGTGSGIQTGHSDNGQTCADFTCTSDNDSSSLAHPNIERCRSLREHSKYTCRYCGSECNDRKELLRHIKTIHNGRLFVCCQCLRSYVTKDGLKQHVDRMHNKLYRYRCETCERCFMNRSHYHDHVATHSGVKQHTCSICEMKFMNKSSLKAHVLRFHPNNDANNL